MKEVRSEVIQVRVTSGQKKIIQKNAQTANTSMTRYMLISALGIDALQGNEKEERLKQTLKNLIEMLDKKDS